MITDLENINLTRTEVTAMALLVKRLSWSELRACAVSDDEAYEIKDAIHKLQQALTEAGLAPQ